MAHWPSQCPLYSSVTGAKPWGHRSLHWAVIRWVVQPGMPSCPFWVIAQRQDRKGRAPRLKNLSVSALGWEQGEGAGNSLGQTLRQQACA